MRLSHQDQIALLRRFEPILKFTQGESFYPMDVNAYLLASSLWRDRKGCEPECIVPQGELNLGVLGQIETTEKDSVYYIKFIEPLDIFNLLLFIGERQLKKGKADAFQPGRGRLSRVGLLSRFIDMIFVLSRLLRGRVPGDTSAAAMLEYAQIKAQNPPYPYYARIVRQGSWTVLQYWFFYAFNNWRSGFFGANDHEADWEFVNIYGTFDTQKEFVPEWVAYSAHDFSGKELRRHWEALKGNRIGEHPVVYVAAGSHAGYFSPGEYVTEIKMPLTLPFKRFPRWVKNQLLKLLGQEQRKYLATSPEDELDFIAVPFIEYARGDGFSIGFGQETEFSEPILLDPLPRWVSHYRGLWGLFARDPVAGENGPAGPMYTREGELRRSWYDPVGWVGLETCPPQREWIALLEKERKGLMQEGEHLRMEIENLETRLKSLGALRLAVEGSEVTNQLLRQSDMRIAELSEELGRLRHRLTLNSQMLQVVEQKLVHPEQGNVVQADVHATWDTSKAEMYDKFHPLRELWASLSIGVLLLGFVALALFYRSHLILGLLVLVSLLVFVEAGFRRQLTKVIEKMANVLAIFAVLILVYHFFWPLLLAGVFIAGVFILWENLREFFRLTP